ncbi:MAG TPA: response regulator [Gemmataceae bacterium]|jgi:ActR/RegA family two-component response regulator
MPTGSESAETILIVDDEEPVRRTFLEWLESANLGCRVLTAKDAESALVQANQHAIDLAILDWNLGAGNDGLRLLEDLSLFHPEVAAIMITGFAHQATPLQAMRMGVRDYLDKNQDLDRTTFLTAVRRQLERIRPARRARQLHQGLIVFRSAVEKVLPLVQAAATLHDPVPLPAAVSNLFQFLLRTTGARDGVLLIRSYDAERQPAEIYRAYDTNGQRLDVSLIPFARSLAGSAASMQKPSLMERLDQAASAGNLELQSFERGRRSLLAAPLSVAPGLQAVLELFDKQASGGSHAPGGGFTESDRQLASAVADFGTEMLRQALTERQMHRVLFEAIEAAVSASDSMAQSLDGSAPRPEDPPPAIVMQRLREELDEGGDALDADATLRLAESIRVLAVRHGSSAVHHCIGLVESLRQLLDELSGETRT